ncbi:MAG: flagellar hook-basal body complex protein [Desulfovibrio sp.]|jgi:flagellar hook protein FlgE|nr:flagellar hook-basal body complex protein [Desulfovibrio sp.]
MMSSLYIGASGMQSHSTGMSVVTNNLANINTVGYKQNTLLFSDLVSQFLPAQSNTLTNFSQKGSGVQEGATRTLFTQMAFETGSEATDIGIEGIGFFGVTANGQTQYTRAGNFRFTKDGYLVTPDGWRLLGHAIVNGQESPATTPVQLDFSSASGVGRIAPQATTAITAISQLGGIQDSAVNTDNPFFALAAAWDGAGSPPLDSGQYSYAEPLQFYDSSGTLRNATVYYDLAGAQGGQTAVEYLVALDPAEDASSLAGTRAAGLLMAGTLTFSSTGTLDNLTAFLPPASGNPGNLQEWTPASLRDGNPVFSVSPSNGSPQAISLNMGLTLNGSATSGLASAAEAAARPEAIYTPSTAATLQGSASTLYGSSPGSISHQYDGFAEGFLYNTLVSTEGVLQGRYSNGQTQDLYRIPLYRFVSQDGLRREGSNRFSSTPESGAAQEGAAGTENFGTTKEYCLEQSNVDYASEFVTMIITQRGFQMNSKVVTTSDQMLQKALELKR